MALWLFRHKSRRKRPRITTPEDPQPAQQPRSLNTPEGATTASSSVPARQPSTRKNRPHHEPNKLHRRPRYSFESGRSDTLEVDKSKTGGRRSRRNHPSSSPPRGAGAAAVYGRNPAQSRQYDSEYSGDVIFDRTPTLHHPNKRDGQHLVSRTKSSKRRKNAHDREREAEIKAMSNTSFYYYGGNNNNNFTPLRPAAEPGSAGRPMKKKSVRRHGSIIGRHGSGSDRDKRHSDVSLPPMESIDSAMSSDSEQISYTVSALDALAPKPTLRYASHPRLGQTNNAFVPQRLPSQRRKLSDPIPEATLKAHKRVDDLADDLNASDLRELMERDARRRERKRQRDQERAQRRLARQAEKQRQEAAGSSADGDSAAKQPESPSLARGVMGREAVGLGIDTTSAIVTSSRRRKTPQSPPLPSPPPSHDSPEPHQYSPSQHGEDEHQRHGLHHDEPQHPHEAQSSQSSASMVIVDADAMDVDSDNNSNSNSNSNNNNRSSTNNSSRRLSPIDMFHRTDSITGEPEGPEPHVSAAAEAAEQQESDSRREPAPVPARHNSRLKKLVNLRSMRSVSSSIGKNSGSVGRQPSDSSSSRAHHTWGALGALFRFGVKPKRSSGPSTFSNLSRDSILAAQAQSRTQPQSGGALQQQQAGSTGGLPFAPAGPGPHPMKVQSNVPKRTLSRFREDLPDFLMSPPRSRRQTPEVELPEDGEQSSPAHVDDDDDFELVDRDSIIPTPTSMQHPDQQHRHRHSSQDANSLGNSMSAGTRDTPTSWMHVDEPDPSPEPPQSMSLASIDSEGSWLSGGMGGKRRRSPQMHRSLDDVAHMQPQHQHHQSRNSNESRASHEQRLTPVSMSGVIEGGSGLSSSSSADEDVAGLVADDEYLNRRFAGHHETAGSSLAVHRESADEIRASSDEEDGARWGSVTDRKVATIVPGHTAKLMKSREGLMKTYLEGEDATGLGADDSPISETSPTSPISQGSSDFKFEEAGVQRATSVNLGRGHVRHISAGSAKLLEISPRNSVDAKATHLI